MSRSLRWLQSHTTTVIIIIWSSGLMYAYIPLRHTGTRSFELNGNTFYQCSYNIGLSRTKHRFYMTVNFVLTFALPSIIMTIAYVAIMRKVRHSERQISNSVKAMATSNENKNKNSTIVLTSVGATTTTFHHNYHHQQLRQTKVMRNRTKVT